MAKKLPPIHPGEILLTEKALSLHWIVRARPSGIRKSVANCTPLLLLQVT